MKTNNVRYKLSIGQMRNIITLMQPVQATGFNSTVTYPEELREDVYCKVIPGGNDRELQEANLTYDEIATVYIRYRSDFGVRWKFIYNGNEFTVHKVTNVTAVNRFLEILAYSKVS